MPPIEARKSSPSTFSGRPPGPGPEVGPILRILGQALSSKTRAEIEWFRDRMGNQHPFVAENGGAVFAPAGYFRPTPEGSSRLDGYDAAILGRPWAEVAAELEHASRESGCPVRGFSAMSVEEIAAVCGLDREAAARARRREFDEPFEILDEHRAPELLAALGRRGIRYVQGGRFWHAYAGADKGGAVEILRRWFRAAGIGGPAIGLGDSPSDLPFLDKMDIPVVVKRRSSGLQLQRAGWRRTRLAGPPGWNRTVLSLIAEPPHK